MRTRNMRTHNMRTGAMRSREARVQSAPSERSCREQYLVHQKCRQSNVIHRTGHSTVHLLQPLTV